MKGFEYLAGAYTIAILKFSQFLKRNYSYQLADNDHIQIKLTNTLEDEPVNYEPLFPIFSQETKEANKIKSESILVIMGNPPYSIGSENKSPKITNLMKDYKDRLNERSLNSLSDDYVKFIRFAHDKIEKQAQGVISIITNNSFLDGAVHRQMREKLIADFDKIYIFNLHGNAIKQEGDKNVFDIRVGVCITLLIKLDNRLKEKEIRYFSTKENAYLNREQKYDFVEKVYDDLATKSINESINWQQLTPKAPYFFLVPKNLSEQKDYDKFWSLKDIFQKYNSGIQTGRDRIVTDYNKQKLAQRIIEILDSANEQSIREKYDLKDTGVSWQFSKFKKAKFQQSKIMLYNHSPFNKKWVFYDVYGLKRYCYEIMQHFILGENIGLVTIRKSRSSQAWKHAFVTDTLTSEGTTLGTLDNSYVFPLFIYENQIGEDGLAILKKSENITPVFRKYINEKYGEGIAAEQILGYVYATLYSPIYRERYNEFLKIDFPRILFTDDKTEFEKTANLGCELIELHLIRKMPNLSIAKINGNNHKVFKIFWQSEKLYINPHTYFEGVSNAVYEYEIGGYKVLQKYLKERENQELSLDEIEHLQKVIKVITQTINLLN